MSFFAAAVPNERGELTVAHQALRSLERLLCFIKPVILVVGGGAGKVERERQKGRRE